MKYRAVLVLSASCLLFAPGYASTFVPEHTRVPVPHRKPVPQACRAGDVVESGRASWYGPGFDGQRAADGSRFHSTDLTAAHPDMAFGTRIQVRNKRNGRHVVVKITDRGPFVGGRIIDVSRAAARKLGFAVHGTAPVEIRRCLKIKK